MPDGIAVAGRERAFWVQAAGVASVATALIILVLKGLAWWQTGAASVLAALVDSAMDLLSSTFNLLALRFATRPADDEHRYGHGKAEALAAFVQALLLIASASAILVYSLQRLYQQRDIAVAQHPGALWLMITVLALTALLVLFQRWVVQRTGSPLVAADSLHYRSDFLINGGVILAMFVAAAWVDAVVAALIALYLYVAAGGILRASVNELLDRELPLEVDERLMSMMLSQSAVRGAHRLRTRRAGGRYFVQVDLELPPQMPLAEVHGIAAAIQEEIRQLYPDVDLQLHFDPAGDPPPARESS